MYVSIARFLELYPGAEEFYILNHRGELGYIRSNDLKPVKENFAQARDPAFLARHPHYPAEVTEFQEILARFLRYYLSAPQANAIELGYVAPADQGRRLWRSATLVLHEPIVARFRAREDVEIRKGMLDPFMRGDTEERMHHERGIHRGMDDLVTFTSESGAYAYFPVLYFRRPVDHTMPAADHPDQPLRVLDLLWTPGTFGMDGKPVAGAEIPLFKRGSQVFDVLRDSLIQRGAIDRQRRVEYRYSIS